MIILYNRFKPILGLNFLIICTLIGAIFYLLFSGLKPMVPGQVITLPLLLDALGAICLLVLTIHFLSTAILRQVTLTTGTIIDQQGFPVGSKTFPLSSITRDYLAVDTKDQAKPGLDNNMRTTVIRYVLYGPLLAEIIFARKQQLILLDTQGQVIGKINLSGFAESDIQSFVAVLRRYFASQE